MEAERCQKAGQADEPGTRVTKPKKKIPIHGELKAFIDLTAHLVPDPTSPEKRLLWNIIYPRKDLIIVEGHHPSSNLSIFFVDDYPVTIHHINFRMAAEKFRYIGERAGKKEIVRIKVRHDFPRRMTETQVDAVLLSSIPCRFPVLE